VIEMTTRLLETHDNVSRLVMKSSRGVEKSLIKKIGVFCGGIYNVTSYYEMKRLLREDTPDVVHIHSVYPMFSPSVLVACRRAGVPVVMTVHSHILTCPNWYHLYKGDVCEECVGGHEYRCVLKNCRDNYPESIAYALRSSFARVFRLFQDNVTFFIVLSDFAKGKLLEAGFHEGQIVIVPNGTSIPEVLTDPADGEYIAFAGRLSLEKGIDTLLSAVSESPQLQVRIAGDGPLFAELRARAPVNVKLEGMFNHDELMNFYRKSRFVVVPSICFEQFGIVAIEAMSLGLPVIAARVGGLPEVVDHGVTGLLFEPGNAEDLEEKIQLLWENPELCKQMGKQGREKVIRQYTQDTYYNKLMEVYYKAIKMVQKRNNNSTKAH